MTLCSHLLLITVDTLCQHYSLTSWDLSQVRAQDCRPIQVCSPNTKFKLFRRISGFMLGHPTVTNKRLCIESNKARK